MEYRLWCAMAFVLNRMPLRLSYAVADCCGLAGFWCWPRGRHATMANFRHVLPGAPAGRIRRTARRSIQNYCRYLVDFARLPALDAGTLSAGAVEELLAGVDEIRAGGRGAIIVSMHFGNWDRGAAATAARGYETTVIGEAFADPRLHAMVFGARERLGLKVVTMERFGPSVLRALKQGGLLALLIDRPMPGTGTRVEFFGAAVEVPAGPARIALQTGAAVVPVLFARTAAYGPEVTALADFSVDVAATGDSEADIRRITQAVMAAHERFIRRYPEQWYMFREMWPQDTTRTEDR